jgi:hypothetical protein
MSNEDQNENEWPPHKREWEQFLWEIGEHAKYHSHFGNLSDTEARRVWSIVEDELLAKYPRFVRVWPEWGSSGIRHVPYPGSRYAGKNYRMEHLGISSGLRERFQRWQEDYDSHEPWAPEKFHWQSFNAEEEELARALKFQLGEEIYVEREGLREMLMDGTIRDWRPLLGLPEIRSI